MILLGVPILFWFLQSPRADAERRAMEIWMESARAQTAASQRKLIAAERNAEYIDRLNEFSKKFNQCFVENYKMGKDDRKHCSRREIDKALDKFFEVAK